MVSSNWAGYGLLDDRFTSVSAEWTQPEVDCSNGREANVSVWVGLDGVTSGTVQQTGTSTDCSEDGTTPEYYAWYEIYPAPMKRAMTLAVHPGDQLRARVDALDKQLYGLTLENLTTGAKFNLLLGRYGDLPTSAEWVVEPAAICLDSCVTSELAQFEDVTFTNIAAETADGPVELDTYANQLVEFDLRKTRRQKLADVTELATDDMSFGVSWLGEKGR